MTGRIADRVADRTALDLPECSRAHCVVARQQLADVLRVLRADIQPGGRPIDALEVLLRKAQRVLRQRNAYRAALRRAAHLVEESGLLGRDVYREDLARAIYVRPTDLT